MLRSGATRSRLLATALAVALAGDAAASDLWRWIDAEGVPRYTPDPDRVPAAQRSTLVRVEPGMPPAAQREPAAAKPPAIFAPPGDPALAADPWNEPERARAIEGEVVEDELLVEELPSAQPSAPPSAPPAPSREGDSEPLHSVDAPPAVSVAPPRQTAPQETAAQAPQAAPPRLAPIGSAAPQPAAEVMGEVVVELPSGEPESPAIAPTPSPRAQQPPSVDAGPALATVPGPALPAATPAEPPSAARAAPAAASAVSGAAPPASMSAERAARRAELLAAIARDEEALKAHVSSTGSDQLAASQELREIAERLPALQAELRALEAQGAAP